MECNSYGIFINIAKNIVTLIRILAPILLIFSLMYIFISIMRNPDEKKNYNKIRNAMIATVIIFFIVNIVDALLIMLGSSTEFSNCWNRDYDIRYNSNYIQPYETDKEKSTIVTDPDNYEKGELQGTLSKSKNTKVVFIGNSKTYVSNIPDKFGKIAANAGYKVTVSSITEGGQTLSGHSSTKASAIQKSYDIAVLQEQTDTMESNLPLYTSGAKAVANLLRQGNSNVSIYVRQCWGLKSNVNNSLHKAVQNNAATVASAINGTVINDGLAWDRYGNMSALYSDDTHQSNAGAYLSAICIYKALSNSDPTNITYYGGLDENTAKQFQKIAKDVC